MKRWKGMLLILLVVSNIVTLFLYVPLATEKKFIKNHNGIYVKEFVGKNKNWEVTNASIVLSVSSSITNLGQIKYIGNKPLNVTRFEVDIFSVSGLGEETRIIGSTSFFEPNSSGTILKGKKFELGTANEGLDLDTFKLRFPIFENDKVKLKIRYKVAGEKEMRHESFFLSST